MLIPLAKAAAICIIVIVVLFCGYVLWRSLFPPKEPNSDSYRTQEQYSQEQRADKNPNVKTTETSSEDRIAVYTLALAVFTALLVLVSAFQIAFLINSNDTATKTAQAAKDAANAARDAVEHSDRNAAAQLRAYVFMDSFFYQRIANIVNEVKSVVAYTFQGSWKNVGQTPAINVNGVTAARIMDSIDTGPVIFMFEVPKDYIGLNIGGGITVKTGVVSIPISDILSVLNNKKRLFVFSRIYYFDVFDHNIFHFAAEVYVVNDPTPIDEKGEIFHFRAITD
jgi:hypothetical protein